MCKKESAKNVRRILLAIPSKIKNETRLFEACLIEKSGDDSMISQDGCGVAFNMAQFLEKKGAKIIEP